MSEVEEFRSGFLARQAEAEEAMVQGNPEPRMRLWSRRDPVSLFGAGTGGYRSGWDELSRIFQWVASTFSDVSDFRFDVEVAAPVTVRVTHAYRREDGEWKIVHRHGDSVPVDQSPPA